MSHDFQLSTATVLNREERGETSLYLTVFSDTLGLVGLMKKLSAKKTSAAPDIFDDIAGNADSPSENSVKFLRDFEILNRRNKIAESYEAFVHAAAICSCAAENGRHIEEIGAFSARLRKALDALAAGLPPQVVRLKFMYLLARGEGYPVLEDFYGKLGEAQAALFTRLVKSPSAECADLSTRADDILEKFLAWIYAETDIIE